jgi:hypothetical protein
VVRFGRRGIQLDGFFRRFLSRLQLSLAQQRHALVEMMLGSITLNGGGQRAGRDRTRKTREQTA